MTFPPSSVVAADDIHDVPRAPLLRAMMESRARWRSLVRVGADLGFETDTDGRFTLVEPEAALGWPDGRLIGTRAEALLAHGESGDFNPFRVKEAVRNQLAWLRDATGNPCCMLLSVSPIAELPGGVRGLGVNITEAEKHSFEAARTLSQREITRVLTSRMSRSPLPFAGIATALRDLIAALQAEGAMLVLHEYEQPLRVAAFAGDPWPDAIGLLQDWLAAHCAEPAAWHRASVLQGRIRDQSLLLSAGANHFIDNAALVFWRSGPGWNEDETALAGCMLRAILPVLEHEQIQRETARQSMTDGLTGLFNRAGFTAELARRLDRLDADEVDATLLVIGLDGFSAINRTAGLEAGDSVMRQAASLLRRTVRASDLVGRLGGDVFSLWLDGTDQFVAAERAHALSQQILYLPKSGRNSDGDPGPATGRSTVSGIIPRTERAKHEQPEAASGPLQVGFSIGVAIRASRSMESIESLLQRGWSAMRACKRAGGHAWQVSHDEPGI